MAITSQSLALVQLLTIVTFVSANMREEEEHMRERERGRERVVFPQGALRHFWNAGGS